MPPARRGCLGDQCGSSRDVWGDCSGWDFTLNMNHVGPAGDIRLVTRVVGLPWTCGRDPDSGVWFPPGLGLRG